MLVTRTFALLLALAVLALPTTAFAQNAGDDQYSDPLAGQGGSSGSVSDGGGGGSTGSSGGGGGGSTVTPTSPTSAANSGTNGVAAGTGTTPQATAAGGSQGELPRTGFDVVVTIELGLAMLLSGLVAHRMIVLRERRDS
jgi:hypothetical protein